MYIIFYLLLSLVFLLLLILVLILFMPIKFYGRFLLKDALKYAFIFKLSFLGFTFLGYVNGYKFSLNLFFLYFHLFSFGKNFYMMDGASRDFFYIFGFFVRFLKYLYGFYSGIKKDFYLSLKFGLKNPFNTGILTGLFFSSLPLFNFFNVGLNVTPDFVNSNFIMKFNFAFKLKFWLFLKLIFNLLKDPFVRDKIKLIVW